MHHPHLLGASYRPFFGFATPEGRFTTRPHSTFSTNLNSAVALRKQFINNTFDLDINVHQILHDFS
jgi:hypothetical protein